MTAEHVKKTCASAWKRIDLMIKARGHTFEPGKKKKKGKKSGTAAAAEAGAS